MRTDQWPLTVSTPRPSREEGLAAAAGRAPVAGLAELGGRAPVVAGLAELGGRAPAGGLAGWGEWPFPALRADGTRADRALAVLRGQWHRLAAWDVAASELGMAVFVAGRPIGMVPLRAHDHPVVRPIGAWPGPSPEGRRRRRLSGIARSSSRPPRRNRRDYRGLPGESRFATRQTWLPVRWHLRRR